MSSPPTPFDRDAASLDPVTVQRAVAGLYYGEALTWAEACDVFDQTREVSAFTLSARLGWTERDVGRFRVRLDRWRGTWLRERLTGDPLTEELLPYVTALVGAVRDGDPDAVAEAFTDAEAVVGDPLTAARGLAVVLAAACPDDRSLAELLAWRQCDTAEYQRLRLNDVAAPMATFLAAVRTGGG